MPYILEINNIVKKYGNLTAVDNVSISFQRGICFGLLGPNGAGKTTLVEIIEDIISADAGEIVYNGMPRGASFREEVGIMFQQTALMSYLTVMETLETFHQLYRNAEDIDQLVEQCHLREIGHQMNDKLSGGQRQRLLLALALVNSPELIFLDEPSTGLDPQARRNLWEIVRQVKAQGKTIILTTHYMEEAQALCDEIAIMDHGRIIAKGSPEFLIKTHCEGITVMIPTSNFNGQPINLNMPFKVYPERVEIQTSEVNKCVENLMSLGVNLRGMSVISPNLEQVFLNLTGRRLRD